MPSFTSGRASHLCRLLIIQLLARQYILANDRNTEIITTRCTSLDMTAATTLHTRISVPARVKPMRICCYTTEWNSPIAFNACQRSQLSLNISSCNWGDCIIITILLWRQNLWHIDTQNNKSCRAMRCGCSLVRARIAVCGKVRPILSSTDQLFRIEACARLGSNKMLRHVLTRDVEGDVIRARY
jgi:hypothetical protein